MLQLVERYVITIQRAWRRFSSDRRSRALGLPHGLVCARVRPAPQLKQWCLSCGQKEIVLRDTFTGDIMCACAMFA